MTHHQHTTSFDEETLAKIEADFDGTKDARAGFNTIHKTLLSLGGVDPGETADRGAVIHDEISNGGVTTEGLDQKGMEDIMKIAPAEPDEIARIMRYTQIIRNGHILADRHGVLHAYERGVFHPVADIMVPPLRAALAIAAFKAELREICRALADWEEHVICTMVTRHFAQIQLSQLADDEDIVPGLPAGIARAAVNKFRAAVGAKSPGAIMAKHRAARNAAIADDEISKAWKRLSILLPVVDFEAGMTGGVGAAVVGPDATLRVDGSITTHDPTYLATRSVGWDVLLPDEAANPAVHAAMATPAGYIPQDTSGRAAEGRFLPLVKHLCGKDIASAQHILGIVGAKLAKHNIGQRGLLLFGATGTGKSVLIKTIHVVFGDGAEAVDVAVMTGQKHDAATIAKLITRRPSVLSCSEFQAPQGKPDYGLLKSLIAGDPISARQLYTNQPVQGHLDALVVLASNRLPSMANDASAAILRRLDPLYIPASASVSGKAEDRDLAAKLVKEAPVIARVLLSFGALFDPSADLPLKMQDSRDRADTTIAPKLRRFLTDVCVVDPTGFVPSSAQPGWSPGLVGAFEQWHFIEYGEYANIRPETLKADVLDAGKGHFRDARLRPPGAGRHAHQVRGIAGLSLKPGSVVPPARQHTMLPTSKPAPIAQPGSRPATP